MRKLFSPTIFILWSALSAAEPVNLDGLAKHFAPVMKAIERSKTMTQLWRELPNIPVRDREVLIKQTKDLPMVKVTHPDPYTFVIDSHTLKFVSLVSREFSLDGKTFKVERGASPKQMWQQM